MATEQVVETVAEGLEVAAEGFEEAAIITRAINAKAVSYILGGVGIGLVVGFVVGYRWNRAKIRAEAFKESEKEVEQIRELYRDAAAAARDRQKPSLGEVVEERGYAALEEAEEEQGQEQERPTRPSVSVAPAPPLSREELFKLKDDGWDFPTELANRSEEQPYIIHQDEYSASETGYKQETLTWYSEDSVLTDEDESPMVNPDDIVGLENLDKFGHGADDVRVVFIRNDRIRMEYEVCLVLNSYASEVQGLSNDDEPH